MRAAGGMISPSSGTKFAVEKPNAVQQFGNLGRPNNCQVSGRSANSTSTASMPASKWPTKPGVLWAKSIDMMLGQQ